MKKLGIVLTLILMFTVASFSQPTSIFYWGKDPYSVASAAVLQTKFASVGPEIYNITGNDSAANNTLITGLTDATYSRIFVVCDTATSPTLGSIQGYLWDTLIAKLTTDTILTVVPFTAPAYAVVTATKSKPEVMWDRADVYTGITRPLIIQYLGFGDFSGARGTATAATDSTLDDSGASWVTDAFIGYSVYIRAGTAIGESSVIEDNDGTSIDFTPLFATAGSTDSQYVIKKAAESYENFYDIYAYNYVKAKMYDLSDATVLTAWAKVLDDNGKLNQGTLRTPFQDTNYLWNTIVAGGLTIFEFQKN
jgi:hypothetical protein